MTDIERAKLRPTLWCRKEEQGYSLFLHNPALAGSKWMTFDTFEDLIEWMVANPGALLTKEELEKDYLQVSFKGFNMDEVKSNG